MAPDRHSFRELHRHIVISPTQLAANTDNWNPTGLATATIIRASTDASRNLTGIVAASDAQLLILVNVGSNDLVLVHDATSTAANRFYCPDNANVTLDPNAWAWLVYDLTSARWRVLGTGTGSIPAGTYVLTIEGGQETINARGTLGATEAIDPTLGNIVTGTLDQNCTLTISAPVGSGSSSMEYWLTQSGGSWTPTFAATGGTFTWNGGTTPTFPASGQTFRVILERIPATSNDWIGDLVGGGATSPLTTKGDLWGYDTADARVPVGTDGQILLSDSTDAQGLSWTNSGRHAHIVGEPFVGDGAQTVFYLANEAELDTVAAYNPSGARVAITQDSTLLDKITFGAAPAAGTGWIDYVPAT